MHSNSMFAALLLGFTVPTVSACDLMGNNPSCGGGYGAEEDDEACEDEDETAEDEDETAEDEDETAEEEDETAGDEDETAETG